MKQKRQTRLAIFLLLFSCNVSVVSASVVDDMLNTYKAEGAGPFDAARGKQMWNKDFPDPDKPGKVRNCHTCHGLDLKAKGKHVRTGKVIDPLAPSANPERLTEVKHIKKWFKRNCKWVVGRECTAQEKGDFLMFLRNQ